MKQDRINIGGQAVIEGVMIRGREHYVVAVRKNKGISSKHWKISKKRHGFLKLPVARGAVNLAEMLVIGLKSIMWSAEQTNSEEKMTRRELVFTIVISIMAVTVFFIALPYFLTHLAGLAEEKRPLLFNFVDGLIRIIVFAAYIIGISFLSDVKLLFEYHGAEHKTIHCYEKGRKLSVENAAKFTTLHPRCGTSFLLTVFIVSILAFSIFPSIIIHYYPQFPELGFWIRKIILFSIRIALIPVIAGISYEILKLSDKKQDNLLFKAVSTPGLLLQKITTKEPSYRQIEVAIAALKKLLEIESIQKEK
ncbi:DUF1385 domain-containing protein [Candidatus Woesearchaeota archaeon]|nr:DUF1385 domain-containing protein [Candidatus Woesearchaeota archaeon]